MVCLSSLKSSFYIHCALVIEDTHKTCTHVYTNTFSLMHPVEEVWPGGTQPMSPPESCMCQIHDSKSKCLTKDVAYSKEWVSFGTVVWRDPAHGRLA